MKYNVAAYLLGFIGEIEAASEEEVEQKIKQACQYPPSAPIIIQYIEEGAVAADNEPEPQAENTL